MNVEGMMLSGSSNDFTYAYFEFAIRYRPAAKRPSPPLTYKLLPAMSRAFSISNALKIPNNVAILRKHGAIYMDRGMIVLNKESGLVTQGTTNIHKRVAYELPEHEVTNFTLLAGGHNTGCD